MSAVEDLFMAADELMKSDPPRVPCQNFTNPPLPFEVTIPRPG